MVSQATKDARASKHWQRTFARQMRHEGSLVEQKFWTRVRNRQLAGYKFKRQVPIGQYIADFVCAERRLVVELDGGQHADQQAYDKERDTFLRSQGYRVLRLPCVYVFDHMDAALEGVLLALEGKTPFGGEVDRTSPRPRRGRGYGGLARNAP